MTLKGHASAKLIGALLAILGSHLVASAALTYKLNSSVLGKTPTSTGPWLTAVFNNVLDSQNVPTSVSLTLTASLNVGSEYISEVAFNINPAIDPQTLSVINDTLADPRVSSLGIAGQDGQNLTGGGIKGRGFDIKINWSTSALSNGIRRFNSTDVEQFTFFLDGLTESDFGYANSSGLYMAARVAGIPYLATTSSGTISGIPDLSPPVPVPESSTFFAGTLLVLSTMIQVLRTRQNPIVGRHQG